jgi:hypothetical protein
MNYILTINKIVVTRLAGYEHALYNCFNYNYIDKFIFVKMIIILLQNLQGGMTLCQVLKVQKQKQI